MNNKTLNSYDNQQFQNNNNNNMFQYNNIYNKENTLPNPNNVNNNKHYQQNSNYNNEKRNDSQFIKIIEEIKNNQIEIFNLDCSIYDLTIDQSGSRIIQVKIESGTTQERN